MTFSVSNAALTPALPGANASIHKATLEAANLDFARSLAAGKTFVSGELSLVREFSSRNGVTNPAAPLNQAGLPSTVQSGELEVRVLRQHGAADPPETIDTYRIKISWPNEQHGTSLNDVVAELNKIPDLKAVVTADGKLKITSQKTTVSFNLQDDASGLLQALATVDSQLRQAFEDFVGQSLFGQLFAAMRKTLGKPAYFHGGRTEEVFQSQLDQVLAENMSKAQGGQFADDMYDRQFNQMQRH